jgi:hypothetical protein
MVVVSKRSRWARRRQDAERRAIDAFLRWFRKEIEIETARWVDSWFINGGPL